MNGAIFYTTRYGSTAQYAQWISEATGLAAYDVRDTDQSPDGFDFLVLGSPVIYHRLPLNRWLRANRAAIAAKPVVLFTVSGAPAGRKLDGWIAASLPPDLIARMHHVALRGRQNPRELTYFDRMMLIIGSLINRDRTAASEELHGFDFMDKATIAPAVVRIKALQAEQAAPA